MSSKRWVINASPLILLGKIGCLDLLESLAPSLAVPQSVIREIESGAEKDTSTEATVSWAKARLIADMTLTTSVASWDLGAGESQVIAGCTSGRPWPCLTTARQGRARNPMESP